MARLDVKYACGCIVARTVKLDGASAAFLDHAEANIRCKPHKRTGKPATEADRVGTLARDELKRRGIKRVVEVWTNPADAMVALAKARDDGGGKRKQTADSDGVRDTETRVESEQRMLEADDAFDPESKNDAREYIDRSIALRRGQWKFRQALLEAYGGKCAITRFDAVEALEAAHIRPYKGPMWNDPTNGLLLRGDIHTLFDLRLIAVNTADMTIRLADRLLETEYRNLQRRNLLTPNDQKKYGPSRRALDFHRAEARL